MEPLSTTELVAKWALVWIIFWMPLAMVFLWNSRSDQEFSHFVKGEEKFVLNSLVVTTSLVAASVFVYAEFFKDVKDVAQEGCKCLH